MSTPFVAVIGPKEAEASVVAAAEAVGRGLARAGALVVTGGLGGVMAAACRGCKAEGGTTVGILPGPDRLGGNQWLDVAVATGLGEARNTVVVRTADSVVAVGKGYGTLSEIALALKLGRPVIGLGSWSIEGMRAVASPEEAVTAALSPTGG